MNALEIKSEHQKIDFLFVAFLSIYLIFGIFSLDGHHGWGADFSLYIAQARALIETGSMVEPNFVRNFENLYISPRTYPPGLPLLLSPFYLIFGLDIQTLKIPILLSFLVSLIGIYSLMKRLHSPGMALAVVLVFSLNPFVLWSLQHILSELPYIMFSIFCLLFALNIQNMQRTNTVLAVYGIMLGLLLFASFTVRIIGLTIFFSVITSYLINTKKYKDLTPAIFTIISFGFAFIFYKTFLSNPTYDDDISRICLTCFGYNVSSYYYAFMDFFLPHDKFSNAFYTHEIISTGSVSLLLTGIYVNWRKHFSAQPKDLSPWLRALRSFSLIEIYFLGTLLLILILPVRSGARFLLPLLPLAVFYVLSALWALTSRLTKARVARASAVVGILGLYLTINGLHTGTAKWQASEVGVTTAEAQQLFDFVTENTDNNDLILTAKPRVFVLFTRRRATVFDRNVSPENLLSDIDQRGITHIILGKRREGLYAEGWMLNHAVIASNFKPVFENSHYRMLEFGR